MKPSPSPSEVAREAVRAVRSRAAERAALRSKSYFKPHERVYFYGVTTPKLREIERGLYQQVRGTWTSAEAVTCCDILIRDRYMEPKVLGLLLLSRFKSEFKQGLLETTHQWLRTNLCNNWALVDTLSPLIVAPLIGLYPTIIDRVKRLDRLAQSVASQGSGGLLHTAGKERRAP